MEILDLDNNTNDGVTITAHLTNNEYSQLKGHLKDLVVFPTKHSKIPATVINTGARHTRVKYVLFPSILRKHYNKLSHDFIHLQCTVVEHEESLYLIYEIPPQPPEKEHHKI